jgi:hypothetical protein
MTARTRRNISDIAFVGFMGAWMTAGAALMFGRWNALASAFGLVAAFWIVGRLAVPRPLEAHHINRQLTGELPMTDTTVTTPEPPAPNWMAMSAVESVLRDAVDLREDDDCRDDDQCQAQALVDPENRDAVVAFLVIEGFLVPAGADSEAGESRQLYAIGAGSVSADYNAWKEEQ